MTGGDRHLGSLVAALGEIHVLLAAGRPSYDQSLLVRLALQRLWVVAGEAAGRYCRAENLDDGVEPWSELRRLRDYLAHHLVEEIDDGRLWAETAAWMDANLDQVRQLS